MKNKEVIIGIIIGMCCTILGTLLWMLYIAYNETSTLGVIWDRGIRSGGISSIIVYGAALNFVAFFGFLKFDKEARAKGVLITTIFTAIIVMAYKLLS